MITVDVEVHPRGDQRERAVEARISIWNVDGDYEYRIDRFGLTGATKKGMIVGTGDHRLTVLRRVLEDAGF